MAANNEQPKYDNFYTPSNESFYETFKYAPLGNERRIRLLRIYPLQAHEDNTTAISCDVLDNLPLDELNEEFISVSYCAGDPKKTEEIFIAGHSFNAFANLGHALRQVRDFWRKHHNDRELLLWADQVSINQKDSYERSHQVSFMGDVYAAAELVLVSLSKEGDPAGGLEWLACLPRQPFNQDGTLCKPTAEDYLTSCFSDRRLHGLWHKFLQICINSPWFRRAWVHQEYIRSREAYFMVAFEDIHWEDFQAGVEAYYVSTHDSSGRLQLQLRNHNQLPTPHPSACQVCISLENSGDFLSALDNVLSFVRSRRYGNQRFRDLLLNLSIIPHCESSDPRDLIYAFLGISEPTYDIYPDYSANVTLADVCTLLARNVMKEDGGLGLIHTAWIGGSDDSLRNYDYPSWVPDWKHISLYRPIYRGGAYSESSHCVPGYSGPSSSSKSTFTFERDHANRQNRILQALGAFQTVLDRCIENSELKHCKGADTSRDFRTHVGMVRAFGRALEGDELWILHGADVGYVFRRTKQYHELIGAAWYLRPRILTAADEAEDDLNNSTDSRTYDDAKTYKLVQDVQRMVEKNDEVLQIIQIC